MRTKLFSVGLACVAALSACDGGNEDGNAANGAAAPTNEARKAAGSKTIAAGISPTSQFAAAAKTAGLDQTLAGPGPYTVLVPDDSAFGKLPTATREAWAKPEGRGEVTRLLTYHILPGEVMADDIRKAIDNGKGKTKLATMGGGLLDASIQDGKIVLIDGKGGKAVLTGQDQRFSNGVVHHVDAVLSPEQA